MGVAESANAPVGVHCDLCHHPVPDDDDTIVVVREGEHDEHTMNLDHAAFVFFLLRFLVVPRCRTDAVANFLIGAATWFFNRNLRRILRIARTVWMQGIRCWPTGWNCGGRSLIVHGVNVSTLRL